MLKREFEIRNSCTRGHVTLSPLLIGPTWTKLTFAFFIQLISILFCSTSREYRKEHYDEVVLHYYNVFNRTLAGKLPTFLLAFLQLTVYIYILKFHITFT